MSNLSQNCMKYLMEGIVYCDFGTCLIPQDQARRLNKERYDVLTTRKRANRGARHVLSEDQRAYHQAKDPLRKGIKKKYKSILHRFQAEESCRNSQSNTGLSGYEVQKTPATRPNVFVFRLRGRKQPQGRPKQTLSTPPRSENTSQRGRTNR